MIVQAYDNLCSKILFDIMSNIKYNLNFELNLHCVCKLLDSSSKLRFLCYDYNIRYVCSTREKALTEPQRTRPACHDRAVRPQCQSCHPDNAL